MSSANWPKPTDSPKLHASFLASRCQTAGSMTPEKTRAPRSRMFQSGLSKRKQLAHHRSLGIRCSAGRLRAQHHCQPTIHKLIGVMVSKSSFIAVLREACWVKKPTGPIAPAWFAGWKKRNCLGSSAAEAATLSTTREHAGEQRQGQDVGCHFCR